MTEDDLREAELFRAVPSAFWLDPDRYRGTDWDFNPKYDSKILKREPREVIAFPGWTPAYYGTLKVTYAAWFPETMELLLYLEDGSRTRLTREEVFEAKKAELSLFPPLSGETEFPILK